VAESCAFARAARLSDARATRLLVTRAQQRIVKFEIVRVFRGVAAPALGDFKLIQFGGNTGPRLIAEKLDLDFRVTPRRGDWRELPSGKEAIDQSG